MPGTELKTIEGKLIAVHKNGPMNILVETNKSMVKFIIFVLLFVVTDELP